MVFLAWNGVWYTSSAPPTPVATDRMRRCSWPPAGRRPTGERPCSDLGRSDVDQPGLVDFKRQFASTEVELTTPPPRPADWDDTAGAETGQVLGRLTRLLTEPDVPNPVTAAAGAELYRYFG